MATKVLNEFIRKGFAMDDERLKQGERVFGKDYFRELLERHHLQRSSQEESPCRVPTVQPYATHRLRLRQGTTQNVEHAQKQKQRSAMKRKKNPKYEPALRQGKTQSVQP